MSSIHGVGGSNPIQRIVAQPIHKSLPTDPTAPQRASDRLELSGLSHMLQAAKNSDLRADKVAEVKAQIESGTYETDAKLDVATDRLLDDLLK